MSTVEKKFVGEVAAEQIVANVKEALNEKQPKGDYALASDKKASPHAITFTGGVTGTYDGSSAVTIDTPRLVNGITTNHSLRGTGTTAEDYNNYHLGVYAMAIGDNTKASGDRSFAEGDNTEATANASHAEGVFTVASGAASHAEGNTSKATKQGSHAEGTETEANGDSSHAEGSFTKANGDSSHAEGYATEANGVTSHAEGLYTYANSSEQHVQGRYNIHDDDGKYAHIVGNGAMDENFVRNESNAHTLDWDGVGWFAGGLQVGGTAQDNGARSVLLTGDTAPNPNAITFTGAVTGTYDGSAAKTVNIPTGETIHYIEGTGSTAGTWLGTCEDITEYYDGLTIAYKIGIAGASTTTLNINGLGAKTVKRATSNLTTQLGVNAVVHLTYTTIDGVGYWVWANYDSGNTKVTQTQSSTATGKYPVILSYYTQDKTTTTAQTVRRDNNFYYQPSTGTLTVDEVAGNAASANKVNNTISFTGEVETTYDGSAAKTIHIPKSYRAATPQDYGATGGSDDTAAFQSALLNNRRVFVPGGNYNISGELVIRDNCELELAQDAVLYFTQTSGNCISMKQCAHLKGNHATVSVPYEFAGNVIYVSSTLNTSVTDCPPFEKWDPQWKTGRYLTDLNIVKPDTRGFHYSMDGTCNGTAVYVSADGSATSSFIWGLNFSGLRIAGGFSYGIRAQNFNSGYNHEMRVEAFMDACEIGVSLESCGGAYVSATIQPRAALTTSEESIPYAKHGIQIIDSRNVDLSGSRIWDWNAGTSLWTVGGEYQHISLIGNCSGLILNDFFYYELSNYDIRSLIYTDNSENLERMTILQEPFTRWFKPIDNKPYFFDGDDNVELVQKKELTNLINFSETPAFTDKLAVASDGAGGVYNEVGYTRYGYWEIDGATFGSSNWIGCTGYIEYRAGQTIRAKGITFTGATDDSRIIMFDSSYNKLHHINHGIFTTATYFMKYTPTEDGFEIVINAVGNCTNTAYVKFNFPNANISTNPIITVDEEIVYDYEGSLNDGINIKMAQVDGLSEILGSYINDVDALIGGDS